MAKKISSSAQVAKTNGKVEQSRSFAIAGNDLKTEAQFADLISALISDTVQGNIPPPILTATCNGVGKLLKMVELRHKYGGGKPLRLSGTA